MITEDQKNRLRAIVRKQSNGEYATKICTKCGEFECDPDGNVDKCSFCRCCRNCLDLDQFKEE